jgi:hypothetical protein
MEERAQFLCGGGWYISSPSSLWTCRTSSPAEPGSRNGPADTGLLAHNFACHRRARPLSELNCLLEEVER